MLAPHICHSAFARRLRETRLRSLIREVVISIVWSLHVDSAGLGLQSLVGVTRLR